MLASNPASTLNQNRTDLGIPNRFNSSESDSKWLFGLFLVLFLGAVAIGLFIGSKLML